MSSSAGIALSVRGISKSYTIAHKREKHVTLAETVMTRLRSPLSRNTKETFWALRDIDFDIQRGDVVGIIGRNGAGKSTLLKVLSRITEPTHGRIDLYGRVGSLLEVGTGFHPELTGRENIFLNGAILGMTRPEIKSQFDAIVEFAGVEQFLDTPVKRYSSGMYVRLAFSVAAHLNPEILIVDEVLAVGDAEFQQKCLGKMKDAAGQGRTVLFVSHNMAAVHLLCNRGIFMQAGKIKYLGDTDGAVDAYMKSFATTESRASDADRRSGSGEYRFSHAAADSPVFNPADPKRVNFRLQRRRKPLGRMHVSAHIVDEMGVILTQCDSRLVGVWLDDADEIEGTFEFRTPWLKPGRYHVDLFVCAPRIVDFWERACELTIGPVLPYAFSASSDGVGTGATLSEFNWKINHRAAVLT